MNILLAKILSMISTCRLVTDQFRLVSVTLSNLLWTRSDVLPLDVTRRYFAPRCSGNPVTFVIVKCDVIRLILSSRHDRFGYRNRRRRNLPTVHPWKGYTVGISQENTPIWHCLHVASCSGMNVEEMCMEIWPEKIGP